MRSLWVGLWALLSLLRLVAGQDVEGGTEEYSLVVVSDVDDDLQTQYILYLNTSSERIGKEALRFLNVPLAGDPNDKTTLCENMMDADFILSISKKPAVIATVAAVAKDAGIPTIQVDYSKWTHPAAAANAANITEPTNFSAVIDTSSEGYTFIPSPITSRTKDQNSFLPKSNYINMVMPTTVMMNVMYALVDKVNISSQVRVLYDDTYDINDKTWQQMLQDTPGYTFTFDPMPLNETEMAAQVKKLKVASGPDGKKIKDLLLMASTSNIEKYVQQAEKEMESKRFNWFILTKDIKSFSCEPCDTIYAFWLRVDDGDGGFGRIREYKTYLQEEKDMRDMVTTSTEIEVSFFLDLTYMVWDYIMTLNRTVDTYPTYSCVNQTAGGNGSVTLTEFMSDMPPIGSYGSFLPATVDGSGVVTYFQDLIMKAVQIEYVKESRILKVMGNWTVLDGITELYPERGLMVPKLEEIKHYKVAIVVQPPFIERFQKEDGSWSWRGYCIDLIKKIKDIVHFDYTLYEVKDKMYGTINEQGEWNGLIGELIKGEADIALAPLSVMAERENFVDFTVPYYDLVGTTILMKKMQVNYSLFKFMTVLEGPVWACIVGAYFFTSFLLWIFDKFSPYSYTNNKEKYKDDPEKREFTFKECLWFCMTSLTPQGGGEAPKNISGRLVAATWWLFGFIIIASYTANLAAFLTVSRLETPISSLDDLAKQYKIKYAPVKGTASETYFKRMSEIEEKFYDIWKAMSLNESMTPQERAQLAVWDYPVSDKFTNMWRYMQEAGLPNSTEDAIQRVLDSASSTDGFAFIGDATEIKYAELINCNLHAVGNEFSRKPYAIAVQQGSPLKDAISSAILKLLNQRDLEALKEQWWNQNPNKKECPKQEDESDGISIQNIGGVFIVILVGIALSIVTLAFEYWYYKDKPRKGDPNPRNGNIAIGTNNIATIQVGNNGNNNELKDLGGQNGINHGQNGLAHYNNAYDGRE